MPALPSGIVDAILLCGHGRRSWLSGFGGGDRGGERDGGGTAQILVYLGATVTAIVLNLPTTGPLLLRALIAQDVYLAGAMILMLSVLTVIGTLISDLLLAWLDPRIRYK